MILALINKGYGSYGKNGTALEASDFLVFSSDGASGGGGITTETDPTVPSWVKNITSAQIAQWNSSYSWGNHAGLFRPVSWTPTWNEVSGKPIFTRTVAGLVPAPGGSGSTRFLREDGNWAIPPSGGSGGAESDPTVPNHVKTISTTNISQWNQAYNWGNWATAGLITKTTADSSYVHYLGGVMNSGNLDRNWSVSKRGIGFTDFSGVSSAVFPTGYGAGYSFGFYPSPSSSARGREFDFGKANNHERWFLKGYSSGGTPQEWKEIWHSGNFTIEEGTWTPVIKGQAGDPSVTYTTQTGSWMKIGDRVFFDLLIQWSAFAGGSQGIRITLPATESINASNDSVSFTVGFMSGILMLESASFVTAIGISGTNFIELKFFIPNVVPGSSQYSTVLRQQIHSAGRISISGNYKSG